MPLIKCQLSFTSKIVASIIVYPKWVYLCHDVVFASPKMFEFLGTDVAKFLKHTSQWPDRWNLSILLDVLTLVWVKMFITIDKFHLSDPWLVQFQTFYQCLQVV